MSKLSKRSVVKLAVVAVALLLVGPAVPASAQASAGVRVVHGLRGVVADVYLDDALVLQTFQPERSTDPIVVAPGVHRMDVRLAGQPVSTSPMLSGSFTISSGQLKSTVLHLAVNGQPAFSVFDDDETPVAAGQTRVVVRHVAAAPAIDVRLGSAPVAVGLLNPGQSANQVAAGTYQVTVTQTGSPQVLAPAQSVPLGEGTANIMYFVGDQAAGTLGWIAVQTAGLQTPPAVIQTGDSGLASRSSHSGLALQKEFAAGIGVTLMGALLMVAFGRRRLRLMHCRA